MPEWLVQVIVTSIVVPSLLFIGSIIKKLVTAKVNMMIETSNLKHKEDLRVAFNDAMGNLSSSVFTSVMETQQIFVSALQKQGAFTEERKKEAFDMAFNKVKTIMSNSSMEIIENATGALDKIITAEIESQLPSVKTISNKYTPTSSSIPSE